MKKCIATVIYKDNTLKNITVNYKGNLISLPVTDVQYPTFNTMCKAILLILKSNNYYTGYYEAFNVKFYDIQFIDLNNPVEINKYGYYEI